MNVRLYLPTTLPAVAQGLAAGLIDIPGDAVAAVDESEDAEYEALLEASDLSAELLSGLPDGARRRLVLVVEAPAGQSSVDPGRIVAVHADAEDDTDPDEDLGWYATQELADLLSAL